MPAAAPPPCAELALGFQREEREAYIASVRAYLREAALPAEEAARWWDVLEQQELPLMAPVGGVGVGGLR